MDKFITITNEQICNALKGVRRQYLAGELKLPQTLRHIDTPELEIGLSKYETYAEEPTHRHPVATEFQYMISGLTEYRDTETGEVHTFRKGDFYAIMPGTCYAQKCKGGTEILFIKIPSINDKEVLEKNHDTTVWFEAGLRTHRKDYYHQHDMPAANSIRPAAAVAIIEDKRILLLRRRDNGKWTMPGGTLEFGETLTACALREIKEETGLEIEIADIIGTYTDPDVRIEYSDGEVRREFTIVYAGAVKGGRVSLDEESSAYQWVDLSDAQALDMAASQKRRINDVITYLNTGKKALL